jgi:hypothetical protein
MALGLAVGSLKALIEKLNFDGDRLTETHNFHKILLL